MGKASSGYRSVGSQAVFIGIDLRTEPARNGLTDR